MRVVLRRNVRVGRLAGDAAHDAEIVGDRKILLCLYAPWSEVQQEAGIHLHRSYGIRRDSGWIRVAFNI